VSRHGREGKEWRGRVLNLSRENNERI